MGRFGEPRFGRVSASLLGLARYSGRTSNGDVVSAGGSTGRGGSALEHRKTCREQCRCKRRARPAFAYTWLVIDKWEKCNGDGIAQLGETVELALEVR
jgi:hypothetical protein